MLFLRKLGHDEMAALMPKHVTVLGYQMIPGHRIHILERQFHPEMPAWRKMPLCGNRGIDFKTWEVIEAEREELDQDYLCMVCLRRLDEMDDAIRL